jgi:hypothetical protein
MAFVKIPRLMVHGRYLILNFSIVFFISGSNEGGERCIMRNPVTCTLCQA